MFFVESSVTTHMCPICQAMLSYRDSRPRIRKKEGGVKELNIMMQQSRQSGVAKSGLVAQRAPE